MKNQNPLIIAGAWPFLLGPLCLLFLLVYFQGGKIEQDVAHNAKQALGDSFAWASPETFNRGRDVLIAGAAPSQEAIDLAVEKVAQAPGVRTVQFVGDVVPMPVSLEPAELEISMVNNTLVLQGSLGDQTSIDALVDSAGRVFGQNRVRNELALKNNIAAMPSLSESLEVLSKIDKKAAIRVENGRVTIMGETLSADNKASITELMTSSYSGNFVNQIQVVAPPCEQTIRGLLEVSKINFDSGKAVIQQSSQSLLQRIAMAARDCNAAQFEVRGHTDSQGSESFNKSLSEQRANAVVQALAKLGLDASRFTARGYGSQMPIADNATFEGRAANRRIEFKVIK